VTNPSDITYVALPTRFVYVAVIVDAWSRLIVGYAIGWSILGGRDQRVELAEAVVTECPSKLALKSPTSGSTSSI
jgi:transposase InsO family protein